MLQFKNCSNYLVLLTQAEFSTFDAGSLCENCFLSFHSLTVSESFQWHCVLDLTLHRVPILMIRMMTSDTVPRYDAVNTHNNLVI